jgi:glycosyltransferase involved in cell wall biosynthesis
MRVIIDGRLIVPHMTGVGRYLLGLCHGLAALGYAETFELWLQSSLPSNHPAWELGKSGILLKRTHYAHMSPYGQLRLPLDLLRASPDLLHYPHFDLPWLTPGRIVVTIHDLKYVAYPRFFPRLGQLRSLVIRVMTMYALRRAQLAIVDSAATARDAQQLLKASPQKLRIVPLGVEARFFVQQDAKELEHLLHRYRISQPYILFVGERRPHKNLRGLLQAFAHFLRMSPTPCQLVIAGQRYAPYQEPEQIAETLSIADHVRFLEHVSDFDLPGLYRAASAFVLLSYYEGFGLPVLEAMASQTPVVVSNRASLPEVAGDAAWIVSPDDAEQAVQALYAAIFDEALRSERIQRGLAWARQFTWENTARLTYQIYQEALR